MIYFPFPDFDQTIASFDLPMQKKQLKQVDGALDSLRGIMYITKRNPKVPPKHVQAWRGYEKALVRYGLTLWEAMKSKVERQRECRWAHNGIKDAEEYFKDEEEVFPPWWGNPLIHESHAQALASGKKDEIYWPDLPVYPQVRSDEEYEKRKSALGKIDATKLDKAELRAYRLEENALMRYIWSSND